MSQRRIDEETGMTVEYALFLAETRGLNFAVGYLESCAVSPAILMRAMSRPDATRHQDRRQAPRAGQGQSR